MDSPKGTTTRGRIRRRSSITCRVPRTSKNLQNRQAIHLAAGNAGTPTLRTDPITKREVELLQQKKDQAEVADFDRYVNSMINPSKPGELQWLMSVYPEFVQRRIEQVHQDYKFAVRNQIIDKWAINTKDDI